MKDIEKSILIQALDQLPVGTLIVDARQEHWPVVYMNSIIGQLTGLDVSTLLGCPWRGLLVEPEELAPQRERLLGSPALVVRHLRQRWQSRSGEPVEMALQVSPLFARPGTPAYWLITVDVEQPGDAAGDETLRTALRDAQLRLRQLDRSDAITGLPNRQAFLEVVQRDWAIAGREQRRLSVLVFQIDALDRYRDLYGKHAADSCLRKIAHAISGSLRRAGDVAARVADNRFAALVGSGEEERAGEFARQIARKVRELAIHHPRSTGGRYVTVAVGLASEVPPWGETDNGLLQKAEAELERPAATAGEREVG
ncbi:MAG: diguanylate cyclase [Gammaproteobacteria bacterium]|nr:diguanylate cyclase [Gammaproteobacteria bacterium]